MYSVVSIIRTVKFLNDPIKRTVQSQDKSFVRKCIGFYYKYRLCQIKLKLGKISFSIVKTAKFSVLVLFCKLSIYRNLKINKYINKRPIIF